MPPGGGTTVRTGVAAREGTGFVEAPEPPGDQSGAAGDGVEACALLSLITSVTSPETARSQGEAARQPRSRRKSELGEATLEHDTSQG